MLTSPSREEIQKGLPDNLGHRYFRSGTDQKGKRSKKGRDSSANETRDVPYWGALNRDSVGHTGIRQDRVETAEHRAYRLTRLSCSGNSSRGRNRGVRRSEAEARVEARKTTAEFRCGSPETRFVGRPGNEAQITPGFSTRVVNPHSQNVHISAALKNDLQVHGKEWIQSNARRLMIGSVAPTCTYNECRGCRFRCRAEQVPVEGNDPMNSAYHYKCICHR
ncbi:hypothetical protein POM88_007952 [Heracleum sosnowskyi]|uniref:Stomagen C-terminal domain-containing protein n=1 Tax=Heracleum sosnowskyi TaxID=360622 RepID=A0AAD8N622_9APIA|nr:hypothetical protein POM88_007952 [Heracleum sosnowskyi]